MQKKSNKKATKRIPARLRARALAIINSDHYDDDTRASIKYQLSTNYENLAEMVQRAENGDTVLDTVMAQAECRNGARRVIALFETKGVPDFLTEAVMTALIEAAAIKNIPVWKQKGHTEDFDAAELANLFAVTPMLSLRKSDKQRVTDATAEILHNPQTPSSLFQAVAEYVCEAMNNKGDSDQLVHSAPMLALILGACPEDERMSAVIAARKEGQ